MFELKEYIILFSIWLISTLFIRSMFKNRSTFPPSPRGLPIIGHLHLLRPIPHQALYKLANKFGPLMHLYLGSSPLLVVSSPEMAKEFLKNNENLFSNRPQTGAIQYLTYGSQDFSFAPYGPYWRFMKKLVMSELLGGRTVESLLPVRNEERSTFLKRILSKAKEGKEIDVGGELIRMSNNVISRMLLGKKRSEEEADDVRHLIHEVAQLAGTFNLGDYIWFLKHLDLQGVRKRSKIIRDKFDVMMFKILKEHRETRRIHKEKNDGSEYVKDMLHLLLDIAEDETAEFRLTEENVKAFVLDIFVAGSDTSAISIEWALSEMIKNPKIMEKAVKELDSVIGKNKLVEESDVANLPYLQAVVRETLRLYPTAPIIVREASEDCTVLGVPIPAKTRTYINVWGSNRDANHWKNPLEFQPERFLTEGNVKGQLDVRGQHYHFLPFGSGRRGCPGTSLALQVVHTTLANMIQCFEWKVKGELNMEEGHGITLPRAHSLVCFPKAKVDSLPLMQ